MENSLDRLDRSAASRNDSQGPRPLIGAIFDLAISRSREFSKLTRVLSCALGHERGNDGEHDVCTRYWKNFFTVHRRRWQRPSALLFSRTLVREKMRR